MQFRKGKKYRCVVSKSPAYKEGRDYYCYVNDKGQLCLKGDDGFEDLVTNLVSGFKPVKEEIERD